jgi:hypothetical protein
LAVALFGLFGFNQARVRSDLIHTPHFFLAAVALMPFLFRGFPKIDRMSSTLVSIFIALMALALVPDPWDWHTAIVKEREKSATQIGRSPPIAGGAIVSFEQSILIQTIQQLTAPGDTVYIGLTRHDRVFANDVMLYFISERDSPTRYQELHPGLVNTEPVQREMIADLEKHAPKLIVLTNMFEGANEPNDSSLSSGVHLLDDYIRDHYHLATTAGSYRFLRLR